MTCGQWPIRWVPPSAWTGGNSRFGSISTRTARLRRSSARTGNGGPSPRRSSNAVQWADIQHLEQFAQNRRRGNPLTVDPMLVSASAVSFRAQRTIPNRSRRPDNSAAAAIDSKLASG